MSISCTEVNEELLILTKKQQFIEVNERQINYLARMDNKPIILRGDIPTS